MDSDTDRARRSLGRARMMMQSECQCRPQRQQNAQTRYPLRNRTHERDPKNALFEFTLDAETKATFTAFHLIVRQRGRGGQTSGLLRVGCFSLAREGCSE